MLDLERYDRQLKLHGLGMEGQQKLASARVLIIGAGGLGCPVLQYLAAAGVGNIGIVDDDVIALSNLQRQVLYTTNDVGKLKAEVASSRLRSMNPDISIRVISEQMNTKNIIQLLSDYELIVDCTDNFPTRYLIDDACRLMEKTLIFGAIYQYEGQVAVFNIPNDEGLKTSYRNLFPEPPRPSEVPDCNDAGVLGVLASMIGTIQATEVIKLITGIGNSLSNKLLTINLLNYQTILLDIPAQIASSIAYPTSLTDLQLTDYNLHCGMKSERSETICPSSLYEMANLPDTVIIDVREPGEYPKLGFPHLAIPLSNLTEKATQIQQQNIIVICQSGKRSFIGMELLHEQLGKAYKISHLDGGINNLKE